METLRTLLPPWPFGPERGGPCGNRIIPPDGMETVRRYAVQCIVELRLGWK